MIDKQVSNKIGASIDRPHDFEAQAKILWDVTGKLLSGLNVENFSKDELKLFKSLATLRRLITTEWYGNDVDSANAKIKREFFLEDK